MSAFLIAIVSAALALAGGTFLRWWQYGRDAWNGRVDRVCTLVDLCVAKSSDYWLLDLPTDGGAAPRPTERLRAEAEIIGIGLQLSGLIETLCSRFSQGNQDVIWSQYAKLEAACQGANFQTLSVKFDPDSARLVHAEGARLIVAIRAAVDNAFTVEETLSRLYRSAREKGKRCLPLWASLKAHFSRWF